MRLLLIFINFKGRNWLPLQLMSIALNLSKKTQLVLSIAVTDRLTQTSRPLKFERVQHQDSQPTNLC